MPSEPLLLMKDGERWSSAAHRLPFAEAAKAARLPDGATIYCLRHTAITRALLAGVPVGWSRRASTPASR